MYAFRVWTWDYVIRYTRNITIWVSPTDVWTNGTQCVDNWAPPPTYAGKEDIKIVCANPIANTRFVTIQKPITDKIPSLNGWTEHLYMFEMQILRAGELLACMQGAVHTHAHAAVKCCARNPNRHVNMC